MKLKKIKSQSEYLKCPNRCPCCNSDNLRSYEKEINELSQIPEIHQDILCLDCGETWTDIYTLTGFDIYYGFGGIK